MDPRSRHVRVWFCGDDLDDCRFAQQIVKSVDYTEAHRTDVDAMERADDRGVPREEGFWGTPVFVVSRTMLAKDYYRYKLVHAAPRVVAPGYMAFYICRGITVEEVRRTYPDMSELFDMVMVGEEDDLPEMLCELREYTAQKAELTRAPPFLVVKWLASTLGLLVGTLLYPLYYVGYPAALALIYFLVSSPPSSPAWADVAAWFSVYGAGFSVNRLTAFDFWPWLGRKWRLPHGEVALHQARAGCAGASATIAWLSEHCLQPPARGTDPSECSQAELFGALRAWFGTVRRDRILHVARLLFLLVPAGVLLADRPVWSAAVSAIALALGLLFPVFYYWASDFVRWLAYRTLGLNPRELERTEKFFQSEGASGRLKREEWALRQSLGSGFMRRSWFRRRDFAFISYAWADEAEMHAAERLEESLHAIGVPCFLDRRNVRSKFAAWRPIVSTGLLESTHVFVVLGPRVLEGSVIRLELRMTLQRWFTELPPAVICVVDPEVADGLRERRDLPPELRFILDWCPQLTPSEAEDPETVGRLVRQRRRQGLLRDWAALLSPVASVRRFLALEAVR